MFYQDDIVENNLIQYMHGTDLYEKLLNYNNYFIFGGAVRDAFIKRNKCEDIDIVCIDENLKLPNATFLPDLNGSMAGLNSDSRGINLAGSKFKYANGLRVDIMYPSDNKDRSIVGLLNVINAVDINTSGIAYHHTLKFIEVVPLAIEYCSRKIFKVRRNVDGLTNRTESRIENLINLGFFRID